MEAESRAMKFIQARNYTPAGRDGARLLVIHTCENPEKPGTALAVAKWFASPSAPRASAHYTIDNKEAVQCVAELDVAWAAPGANRDGIHLEHAGRASQTAADWADAYSEAMLQVSADLAADIAHRYGIPIVKLTPEQVADGKSRGFCGHVDVTRAFPKLGSHTDPGGAFPWAHYLELVRAKTPEEAA